MEKKDIHHSMNADNEIEKEGAKALALGLRTNKGLWKLDISCESVFRNEKQSDTLSIIHR